MAAAKSKPRKTSSGTIFKSWDLLRYFLALTRHGSARLAAKAMGADHSTLIRKVKLLEHDLGKSLFERAPGDRLSLTPAGEELRVGLTKIEQDLFGLALKVVGNPDDLSGTVRIGVSEGLGTFWLLPRLSSFREQYPTLQIELVFSSGTQDLAREIDLALRFYPPREDHIIRRQLGLINFSFYGTEEYFQKHGDFGYLDEIRRHFFFLQIGQSSNPAFQSLMEKLPEERIRLKASDSHAILAATKTGQGLALLPNYIERVEGFQGVLKRASVEIGALMPVFLCFDERKRNISRIRKTCDEIAARFNEDRGEWFR